MHRAIVDLHFAVGSTHANVAHPSDVVAIGAIFACMRAATFFAIFGRVHRCYRWTSKLSSSSGSMSGVPHQRAIRDVDLLERREHFVELGHAFF